jgi:hypothetical protein
LDTSGPHWRLDDDRKTITITFPTNPPVAMQLDAEGISDLLTNVGEMRAVMEPAYAADWTSGGAVGVIPDPRWFSEHELMEGNSLLHVRDPRFGWLHYMFPREGARQLGQYLIAQADLPLPGPKPDKAN